MMSVQHDLKCSHDLIYMMRVVLKQKNNTVMTFHESKIPYVHQCVSLVQMEEKFNISHDNM